LFVALGGGAAWASGLISGSQIKNHSIPAKKLTASAIKSLHGQRGPTGPPGPKGDTGAKGDTGPQGNPGTALAYAHINPDGTLDSANSSGLTGSNYTHNGPGEFCFHGLSFTPHNVVASIDAATSGVTPGALAEIALGDLAASYCPTGYQAAVITTNTNVLTDFGAYILFN
jgi:hypothetical protein